MKPKNKIQVILLSLVIAALACRPNLTLPDDAIAIVDLVTENINVAAPNPGGTSKVKLSFGAGDMIIRPGASGAMISGTAAYNVADLALEITTKGDTVTLSQDTYEYNITGLPNFGDVENVWDLYFSADPIDLEIRTGAFDGVFDFGGLAIRELNILDGASDVTLSFSSPNLTAMGSFTYTTGASDVDLIGLANANFSLMKFTAGVGNYLLDFSGTLQRDATVNISSGLSNIQIIVPVGIPVVVYVDDTLASVTASGSWVKGGEAYSQAGSGPTLTIYVEIGAGFLSLKN